MRGILRTPNQATKAKQLDHTNKPWANVKSGLLMCVPIQVPMPNATNIMEKPFKADAVPAISGKGAMQPLWPQG
jgi:hypothetical protein